MMVDSEDDFGEVDEEAMQGACTQVEATFAETSNFWSDDFRPAKRQRVESAGRECKDGLGRKHGSRGTEDFLYPSSLSDKEQTFDSSPSRRLADTILWNEQPSTMHLKKRKSTPTQNNGFGRKSIEFEENIPHDTGDKERRTIEASVYEQSKDPPNDFYSFAPPQNRPSPIDHLIGRSFEEQYTNQQQTQPPRNTQEHLRQTTLFGGRAGDQVPRNLATRGHNYRLANRSEAPTHHELNVDNLQTWVYPTNLGSIREYQYSIVSHGLFNNVLVALPTGLGKTFIAATVMLNWYRWTKSAQIVFVAPTKPLVAQQVEACFNVVGIPRSDTALLTGTIAPGYRAEEWRQKRVFFMTPQTFNNDLASGISDPKRIVLVVVDEAHRATGNYSYNKIVTFIKRFNSSFRVLALTATPGSSVEAVQEVIDGLGIAHTEIRTEESRDIREYVQPRSINTNLFENSEEMEIIMKHLSITLQPHLTRVRSQAAYLSADPMSLNAYMCNLMRQKWLNSDAGRNASHGLKNMMNTLLTMLASLGHAIELLKFHGIGPFYQKMVAFREEAERSKAKTKQQITKDENFQKMMSKTKIWLDDKEFVGHPKLQYLSEIVMDHFVTAGEGKGVGANQISPASTRVMVFAHYRDSAEEIARVLNRYTPIIRAHVFVGQAASSESEGMGQKKQLEIIQTFKSGIYNTLVATSIGEEGLDIGEVDLIVCYDASASPIRMLQRMGRTGRKRSGRIEVLLMKGKEEEKFNRARDNYEKMQQMITDGKRFTYHVEDSPRILPRGMKPTVDRCAIEIPLENSQADCSIPKRRKKPPKKPPKRFNMPDNVRTGFTKASRYNEVIPEDQVDEEMPPSPPCADIAPVRSVLLTKEEVQLLEQNYLNIDGPDPQSVESPNMKAFPCLQRLLRPRAHVEHGKAARKFAQMMAAIHDFADAADLHERLIGHLELKTQKEIDLHFQWKRRGESSSGLDERLNADFIMTNRTLQKSKTMEEGPEEDIQQSNALYDVRDGNDSLNDFIVGTEESPLRRVARKTEIDSTTQSDEDLINLDELIGLDHSAAIQPRIRHRRKAITDSDEDDNEQL